MNTYKIMTACTNCTFDIHVLIIRRERLVLDSSTYNVTTNAFTIRKMHHTHNAYYSM